MLFRSPHTLALAIPAGLPGLPPVLDKPTAGKGVNAWVCEGVNCLPPIDDLSALADVLRQGQVG